MELLTEWGLEILFGLISAGALGYAKWRINKITNRLKEAEQLILEKELREIENSIEIHLEPIRQDLEDLRNYINEQADIEKRNMSLIIGSYRFRLIQLCKAHLAEGTISSIDLEQLIEFYKVYVGLGGNGQAKDYYNRTIKLPIKDE